MTTLIPPAHPCAPHESYDPTLPSDLNGDFQIGDLFVRVSRSASSPGPDIYFAVASSREELDAAPVFDQFDIRFFSSLVKAINDIADFVGWVDVVDEEKMSEWFADRDVPWFPSS